MITIYIKQHNKTGLLYLGKTNKQDPHKYHGSGKRWLKELKEHGIDYTTMVLEQVSSEHLSERGRFWSTYYRVTSAMDDYGYPIWANLIPETGGGPGHKHSKEVYERMASEQKGKKRPELSNSVSLSWQKTERKQAQTNATSGDNHYSKRPGYVSPRLGKKYPGSNPKLAGENNPTKRPEVREKMRKPHGPKMSLRGDNHYSAKPGYQNKNSGSNHYTKSADYKVKTSNNNYDHNNYKWKNEITGEVIHMNRRDFLKYTNTNPGLVSEIINGKKGRTKTKNWIFLGSS